MSTPEDGERNTARQVGRPSWSVLQATVIAGLLALGTWVATGALSSDSPGSLHAAGAAPTAALPATAVAQDEPDAGQDRSTARNEPRGNAALVDSDWASRTAAATGIPLRVIHAYAGAELDMASESAGCGIRWSTLAALGSIESAHGTHAGSAVGDDGVTRPGIFGIDLTGEASARVPDTDGGRWDGRSGIDRAVGPMQFIPATWETWGADGNDDGIRDPQQVDDAALAAARYLCHHGDLTDSETWRRAVFAYNHLDSYVAAVAEAAVDYAGRVGR